MIVPKIIMILLIDNKNIINGFCFGILLFIIYLFFIKFDLYDIYYTQTTEKILNDKYNFYKIYLY
jgi:hypothetical protein